MAPKVLSKNMYLKDNWSNHSRDHIMGEKRGECFRIKEIRDKRSKCSMVFT